MRRYSQRHQLTTLSEINVTPLLDLAFVLLIIFMITTPLMENSTDVVLPSGDASTAVNMDKVRSVSLASDGRISLNEAVVTLPELEAQLAAARAAEPELAVLIRPHREQTVQHFSDVLDAVKRAGVKRIGFASNPKE
jgi:biopolymer transport protein ExbD